jgi:hypothetical protein
MCGAGQGAQRGESNHGLFHLISYELVVYMLVYLFDNQSVFLNRSPADTATHNGGPTAAESGGIGKTYD